MTVGVTARTATSQCLPIGGLWEIAVSMVDSDGLVAAVAPTVTVTLPDASTVTPTPADEAGGYYRASVTITLPGRYVAGVVGAGYGAVDFTAWASAVVPGSGMPDLTAADNYLGDNSWTDDEIEDALNAEAAAQRSVCDIPAAYPDDLRQALLRRVARNLSLRKLPLAIAPADAEGGSTVLPGRDPEVRRLEAPFRKVVTG